MLACICINAQSVGDYIRTATGKYKVTGANIITNGDFSNNLTGWKSGSGLALSTDTFNVVPNGGPVSNGAYIKTMFSAAEGTGGNIVNSWTTTKSQLYIFAYYTKHETASSTVNANEFVYQNTDGSADRTSGTNYNAVGNSVTYTNAWKQVVYVFQGDGNYLSTHFFSLSVGTDFANFFLGTAEEVANTDSLQGEINIAQAYYDNALYTTGKSDLNDAINAAKAELTNTDISAVNDAIVALQDAVSVFIKANTVDITSKVVSADMNDFTKWTMKAFVNSKKGNNVFKYNTNGSIYAGFAGTYMENWVASTSSSTKTLSDNYAYQTITSLPAGIYELSAAVNATQQANAVTVTGVKLFANSDSVACATGNGAPQIFTVQTKLTEIGDLKIGLNIGGTNANWVAWDNVTLKFIGDTAKFNNEMKNMNIIIAQNALKVMIDSANTVYNKSQYVLGKEVLLDSINIETALLTSTDLTVLANALTYMRNAINGYYATNQYLFDLQAEITKAQASYNDETFTKGKEDLNTAITAAQTDATSTDTSVLSAAKTTLKAAERAFSIANACYKHPANLCINGTMDDGLNNWTILTSGTANPALHINASGNVTNLSKPFMECWVSSATTKIGYYGQANYAYQTAKSLPEGLYILNAGVVACNQGQTDPSDISGVTLFANSSSIACKTGNGIGVKETMEYNLAGTDSIKFGINIDATTTANWVAWDNVELLYVGDAATYRKDSAQALLTSVIDSLKNEYSVASTLKGEISNPNNIDITFFNDALDDAQTIIDGGTTAQEFREALAALVTAEKKLKTSGVFPKDGEYFDFTDLITNPTVRNSVNGWSSNNLDITTTTYYDTNKTCWYNITTGEKFTQVLSGLPKGDYIVEVQGVHRVSLNDYPKAYYDTTKIKCALIANSDSVLFKAPAYDDRTDALLSSTFGFLRHSYDVDTAFFRNEYINDLAFSVVEGETSVTIGINDFETKGGSFTAFRNFKLRFYGNFPVGIKNPIVSEDKRSAVINNNVYSITGTLVRSNATDLKGLAKGLYIVNGKKYVIK